MESEHESQFLFEEKNELLKLLAEEIMSCGSRIGEIAKILEKYQEQPYLVERHLEQIVNTISTDLSDFLNASKTNASSVELIYLLSKLCGYKSVSKFLPHTNSLVSTVLLRFVNHSSNSLNWKETYLLCLWCANVSLVPFDLSLFDSSLLTDRSESFVQSAASKSFELLSSVGAVKDAAGYFLSSLLLRKDCHHIFDFMLKKLSLTSGTESCFLGKLEFVCVLLQRASSSQITEYLPLLKEFYLEGIQKYGIKSSMIRKLSMKFQQRMALIYLTSVDDERSAALIEESLNALLEGLEDNDTIVRWSAAKGIGRLANHLSEDVRKEILASMNDILSSFAYIDGCSSLHGACLAIAEMSRRKLIPPEAIETTVESILLALVFESRKFAQSVGSNVRDSACYAIWSMARSYSLNSIDGLVFQRILTGLLSIALFDREISCRRAAIATFQEIVGRSGRVPEGEKILEVVNFYSVSRRALGFTDYFQFIIQNFSSYAESLMQHLLSHKIYHWDCEIRELAAKSLGIMAKTCKPLVESILNVFKIDSLVSEERSGALLSLSFIIKSSDKPVPFLVSPKAGDRLLKTELIQSHYLLYFESVCQSSCLQNVKEDELNDWLKFILECSKSTNIERLEYFFHDKVRNSLARLSSSSLRSQIELFCEQVIDRLIVKKSDVGIIFLIGALPLDLLKSVSSVISMLSDIMSDKSSLIECRVASSMSIGLLYESFSNSTECEHVFDRILLSLDDYTVDNRGDVGSWLRKASMKSLCQYHKANGDVGIERTISKLLQQSVDKLDKLRIFAIERLCYLKLLFPLQIPFEISLDSTIDIKSQFCAIIPILQHPQYRKSILCGLLNTIGSIGQSIVEVSSSCLLEYLDTCCIRNEILEASISLLSEFKRRERLIVPIINSLDIIVSSIDYSDESVLSIFPVLGEILSITKDMKKISSAIKLLSSIAVKTGDLEVLKFLQSFLSHSIPRIRIITAEHLTSISYVIGSDSLDMALIKQVLPDSK